MPRNIILPDDTCCAALHDQMVERRVGRNLSAVMLGETAKRSQIGPLLSLSQVFEGFR